MGVREECSTQDLICEELKIRAGLCKDGNYDAAVDGHRKLKEEQSAILREMNDLQREIAQLHEDLQLQRESTATAKDLYLELEAKRCSADTRRTQQESRRMTAHQLAQRLHGSVNALQTEMDGIQLR